MNKPIKGITTCIVLASFIYSNCVYGLTSQSSRTDNNTLAWHGLFSQPENVSMIEKILSLEGSAENKNLGQMIDDLRVLFSKILGDEPDGLGVMYNEKIKEAFIYSGIGIVHIYKNKHTEIPRIYAPDQIFTEAGINIRIYRFKDEEKLAQLQRVLAEKKEIITIAGLPSLEYLLEWMERRGAPKIAPAKYAEVAEGLKNKDGSPVKGWLWIRDVPGLIEYNNCNDNRCLEIEIENANRIRDHIEKIGVGVPIAKGRYLSGLGSKEIIVWNGKNGNDKYLNNIIAKNINGLFEKLSTEERKELIRGINEGSPEYGIAVGILDQSRHFVMNCRGDGFIGVSRWLLEKIESAALEMAKKAETGDTGGAEKLRIRLDVLEAYLKTYLYHELRHEAFIEERKVLKDMVYEDIGLAIGMDIDGMDCATLRGFIDSLSDLKRKEFEEELERRQNGYDARYFVNISRNLYELYLDNLTELEILKKDSLFWEAVSIVGYSKEKIDKDKGKAKESKHPNNLVQEDFERRYIKGKYAGKVYGKYENEYKGLYESKGLLFEQECRGKVSYMLYKLGLTANYRIPMWRGWDEEGIDNGVRGELKRRERELAEKSIIKLVEFISKNMIKSEPEPGETEISIFKPREESVPFQMVVSPLFLKARLLTDGAYNEGLLNSDMAFKISGIMETVAGDMGKFWELAVEACQERFERYGDSRFKNIDAKHMKRANIEREKIPRLKILSLFMGYLLSKYRKRSGGESEEVKDLEYLNSIYRRYMKGTNLFFNEEEVDEFETRFNRIYPAAIKALARQFGLNQKVDKKIFDYLKYEEDDMFIALWDAFDFAENLLPDLESSDYKFTEPLIFAKEELKVIKELRTIFDKNTPIKDADIEKKDTAEKIGLILTIYKDKILKYRKGLEYILGRYGTDIDISGKKAWDDLLVFTGGWAGAQWLAREYKTLISERKLYKVLELDSGLSVFYRALLEAGVEERYLDGVYDNVSNKKAEYFGKNPKRIIGDIRNDLSNFRDTKTGEKTELQNDYYELITSLYRIQGIDNIDGLYRLFSNAHSLLKYGGHFAITLPPNRKYSEESLEVLEKKFGFKAEIKGRTWNELSREFKDKIRQDLSPEAVKRIERIAGKEFYVIVLEKVGRLKTAEITPEDKMLLAPIDETERMPEGRPRPPEEYEPGGGFVGISDSQARQAAGGAVRQSAETCGGTTFSQGSLAIKLDEGIRDSEKIKLQAEKEDEIKAHQDLIREMLETQMNEDYKLNDYVESGWRQRIDTALEYKGKYETSVEEELEIIFDYLDKLKSFIKENEEYFINMLNKIKTNEWRGLSGKLSADEVKKYNKVVLYERTNLNKDTFNEVLEVYKALKRIEKEEMELERYRQEHGEEYEKIRRLIEKYEKVSNLVTQGKDRKNLQRDINEILNKTKRHFDFETLRTAKTISERLIRLMLGDNTKYKNLLEFEEKMNLLLDTKKCSGEKIDWMESPFLFTWSDINFLNSVKEDWKRNEVTEQSVFAGKDRSGINRLLDCLGALEEWWVYKGLIEWDKGLAGMVKDAESEKEYLDLIDENLVYAPFKNSLGFNLDKFIHTYPHTADYNFKTGLSNIQSGQNIGITMDEPMNYSDRFLSALEEMGFEIISLYNIWLELVGRTEFTEGEGVRKEAEDFIRRGKRIIIVKMGDTFRDVDEKGFQLEKGSPASPEAEFLYNTRAGSRFGVLNDIDPENLKLCVRELLSGKQIEEKYPEYAKELLAKEELQAGGMFDRKGVESAVIAIIEREKKREEEARRRREEEEERRRREAEREASLIKRSSKPLVDISYTGIWEGEEGKEAVKDLAHILLEIIPDFDAPELKIDTVINNEIIKGHPVLGRLALENPNEFTQKVTELIKYRQYDLQVLRAYKEFGKAIALSLSTAKPIPNYHIKIDGKDRIYDLVNVWDKDEKVEFTFIHSYNLGIDLSPFGDSNTEGILNDIQGQIIELRRIGAEDFKEQCPEILRARVKKLSMHFLNDPHGALGSYNEKLRDVIITAGENTFIFEENTMKGVKRMSRDDDNILTHQLVVESENAFNKAKELLKHLISIYVNKNMEPEYLKDFEEYMRLMFGCANAERRGMIQSGEIKEIRADESALAGFERLLSGNMPRDEYRVFKEELDRRIREKGIMPQDADREIPPEKILDIKKASTGRNSMYYKLYNDEGQNTKIRAGGHDKFIQQRKDKESDITVKEFYELLSYLNGINLYFLSTEEKNILFSLAKGITSSKTKEEAIKYREQIKNYLKTANTVNRYLYYRFMCYKFSWQQEDLAFIEQDFQDIVNELSKYDPKVAVYNNKNQWDKQNLIILLTEFYRLKQMEEDDSLKEVAMEIQLLAIDISEALNERIKDYGLDTTISCVGNPYHKELITRLFAGQKNMGRLHQSYIEKTLSDLNEEKTEKNIKDAILEIFLVSIYYTADMQDILKHVARAIATVMRQTNENTEKSGKTHIDFNINKFYDLFEKCLGSEHCQKLKKMVEEETKRQNNPKNRELSYADILQLAKDSRLFSGEEQREYKRRMKIIKEDQAFRIARFIFLNSLVSDIKNRHFENETAFKDEVEGGIRYIQSPYEIYHLFKNITLSATEEADDLNLNISISGNIVTAATNRLLEFIKEGKGEEVIDMLTKSHNQFKFMKAFICGMADINGDLFKYIIGLFFSDDCMVSSYAYRYLEFYLRRNREGFDRGTNMKKNIDYICDCLLEEAFKKGDEFDKLKMRRIFWLFFTAVDAIPSFRLGPQWKKIACRYRENKISKKTLQDLKRNAHFTMNEYCGQAENKENIIYRIELGDGNAFTEAVTEDGEEKDVCKVISDLKDKDLYILKDEDKDRLNAYIDKMLFSTAEKESNKLKGEITEFLSSDNTINKYLYFKFKLFRALGSQGDIGQIMKDYEEITDKILKTEPILNAYTEKRSNLSLVKLLKEFYRLKQMMKDEHLKDALIDIQMCAIDLIAIIRVKKVTSEKMLNEMAMAGHGYHKELTPVINIGLKYLESFDQAAIEKVIAELGTGISEDIFRAVLDEIHILLLHYPEEKPYALKHIAQAIISLEKNHVNYIFGREVKDVEANIERFLAEFKIDNLGERAELDRLIVEKRQVEQEEPGINIFEQEILSVTNILLEKGDEIYEKITDLINRDQGFRNKRLYILYSKLVKDKIDLSKAQNQIDMIIEKTKNPYELYNLIKTIEIINREFEFGEYGTIYTYILRQAANEMARFIDAGQKNEISHILTDTFNQYLIMGNFTLTGIESNETFRKFIIELFLTGNHMNFCYIFKYLERFIISNKNESSIDRQGAVIDNLFSLLTAEMIQKKTGLDAVRIRNICELFALAAENIAGFEPKKYWPELIDSYKNKRLSREAFEIFGKMLTLRLEKLRDAADSSEKKNDINAKIGLYDNGENIFSKAIREKEEEEACIEVRNPAGEALYSISDSDKKLLADLVEKLLTSDSEPEYSAYWESVRGCLAEGNAVNKYLYFSFCFLSRLKGPKHLAKLMKDYGKLTADAIKMKNELLAYTEYTDKCELKDLLRESYRLRQMLEDESLKEAFIRIQFALINLNKEIRERTKDGDVLYKMAFIGNKYHNELIPDIYIGAEKLSRINQLLIKEILQLQDTDVVEKFIRGTVKEIKILSIYYKDEFLSFLRSAASAIAELKIMKVKGNIESFKSIFREYMEDYYGKLESLIEEEVGKIGPEAAPSADTDEFCRLAEAQTLLQECNLTEREKRMQLIKRDQAYRIERLLTLNNDVIRKGISYSRNELREEIEIITGYMENPYEIYCLFREIEKSQNGIPVDNNKGIGLFDTLLIALAKRMVRFINEGMAEEVTDILTRSYNEYNTMDGIVNLIMNVVEVRHEFRRYLIKLFLRGDHKITAYMYEYFKHFLKPAELSSENEIIKNKNTERFFILLLNEMLKKGGEPDFVRLRMVFELYSVGLENVKGFNLKEQVEKFIESYNEDKISEETLRAIGRNINLIVEKKCEMIKNEEPNERTAQEKIARFRKDCGLTVSGEDIFSDAIKKKKENDAICDMVSNLKGENLYALSEDERNELNRLTDGLAYSGSRDTAVNFKEKLISFIKEDNTINRFLYFSLMFSGKLWTQENLSLLTEYHSEIKKEAETANRDLLAHTARKKELDLTVLLREYYRLHQIMEDKSLAEVSFEVNYYIIDLFKEIRNKMEEKGLMYRLSLAADKYFKDLVSNSYSGASFLGRCYKFGTEKTIGGLGPIITEKDIKTTIQSLYMTSVYFKHDFECVLRIIAGGIAALKHLDREKGYQKISGAIINAEENIKIFLSMFEEYMGKYYDELIRLIDAEYETQKDEKNRDIVWHELDELTTYKNALPLCEPGVKNKMNMLIKKDKAYRVLRLAMLNVLAGETSFPKGQLTKETKIISDSMEDPYEIHSVVRFIDSLSNAASRDGDKTIGVISGIPKILPERMARFIRDGKKEQVKDMLTETYNDLMLMDGFVEAALDELGDSGGLMKYMLELYLSDDPRVSSIIYYYLLLYIRTGDSSIIDIKRRKEVTKKLFELLINMVIKDGRVSIVKRKRAQDLFIIALHFIPDLTLKEQWENVIKKYKTGEISKEGLRSIGRYVRHFMDGICSMILDREKDGEKAQREISDIREGYGLDIGGKDIFEKAIEEETGKDENIEKIIRELQIREEYTLSEEEKVELDGLMDKIMLSKNTDEMSANSGQLNNYLIAQNTINRYLHFTFVFPNIAWAHKDLEQVLKEYEEIRNYVIKNGGKDKIKLAAHTKDMDKQDLTVLLKEFYRLKQMLKEDSLKDVHLEVQLATIELNRSIRRKIGGDVKNNILYGLAVSGDRQYHKELIPDVVIKIGEVQQVDQFTLVFGLEKALDGNAKELRTRLEDAFDDYRIQFIYYPENKKYILEDIAAGIVIFEDYCKHREDIDKDKARHVLEVLTNISRECLPEQDMKLLEELIIKKREEQCSYAPFARLKRSVLANPMFQIAGGDYVAINDLIRKNQIFRFQRLTAITNSVESGSLKYTAEGIGRQFNLIFENTGSPYEFNYLIKWALIDPRTAHAEERTVNEFLLYPAAKKFIKYMGEGRRNEIADILTGSFNQYKAMCSIVDKAMDISVDFRKFMAELFTAGNFMESSYAYEYFKYYMRKGKNDAKKQKEIAEELLTLLFKGLLEGKNELDIVKMRKVISLLADAEVNIKGFDDNNNLYGIIDNCTKNIRNREEIYLPILRNAIVVLSNKNKDIKEENRILRQINDALKASKKHESFQALELIDGLPCKSSEITYNAEGEKIRGADNIREYVFGNIDTKTSKIFGLDFYLGKKTTKEFKEQGMPESGLIDCSTDALLEIPEELLQRIGYEGKVALELVDTSETLFVDCKRNGFIGINRIFLDILKNDKSPDKIISRILLTVGVHHELYHETGISNERWILYEGIDLFNKLADRYGKEGKISAFGIFNGLGRLLRDIISPESEFLHRVLLKTDRIEDTALILVNAVKGFRDLKYEDVLKNRIKRILQRIKEGKKTELSELQMYRLLWLIETLGDTEMSENIAELINTISDPYYTADPGPVIMAINKEILAWLYTEKQLRREEDLETRLRDMKYDVRCRLKLDNMQYNEQLNRRFKEYAERIRIKRDLERDPMTEDEVDMALFRLGLAKSTGELARLRDIIREKSGVPDNISIIFSVPEGGLELFWANDPETGRWTYTGAVFDSSRQIIHIPLPLLLKEKIFIFDPNGEIYGITGFEAVIAILRGDIEIEEQKLEGIKIMREIAEGEMDEVEEGFEWIKTADYKEKVELVSRSPIAFDRFINTPALRKKPDFIKVLRGAIIKNNDLLIVFLENISRLRDLEAKNYLSANINAIVDDIRIPMGQFNMLMDLFIKEQDSQTQINLARGILCILGNNKDIIPDSCQINMVIRKIGVINEKVNNRYDLLSALVSVSIKLLSGNSGYKPGVSELSMLLESFKRNMENIGSETIRSDFIAILATLENFCYLISQCFYRNPGLKEKFGILDHKGKDLEPADLLAVESEREISSAV